ncbi:ATP-dependent RNA helicase DDX3X [Nematocida sp. LUAm3]|nr:ATP-dependent RNA helicase DDX3X [Nematocida sp. LUAm3]KAI5176174.1 ATP-dependent RNA helicase DDX3X [Nematocida sp. LUAm2]KAI5179268.1 ATP-dependent RNA helicase DDX3X [Nematocida sp. LUAm1]
MEKNYIPPYMKREKEIEDEKEKHGITIKAWEKTNPIDSFKGIMIEKRLIRNLEKQGITIPTLIQKYVIPFSLHGHDILACAPTGMGKTIAFLLPAINNLIPQERMRNRQPQVLILTPTRELANQIYNDNLMLTKDIVLKTAVIIGGEGESKRDQTLKLSQGIDIIIATPGRLKDIIDSKFVNFSSINTLILDEADRMLDLGFEPQIRGIVAEFPAHKKRQTMMFSATFPPSVQKIAKDFFTQDKLSEVHIGHGPIETIAQEIVCIDSSGLGISLRNEKLLEAFKEFGYYTGPSISVNEIFAKPKSAEKKLVWGDKKQLPKQEKQKKTINEKKPLIIVFVERKAQCDDLVRFLHTKGIECRSLHGDKAQNVREESLECFKSYEIPILVATSVAARGLDIPGIELVVNYIMPGDIKEYIHRIGRTGRAGRTGKSITFFSKDNQKMAEPLIEVLKAAKQPVPGFLEKFLHFKRPQEKTKISSKKETKPQSKNIRRATEPIKSLEDNISWENEIE